MRRFAFTLASLGTVLLVSQSLASGPKVSYPKGYRDWTHVKSMVIQEGHALYQAFGGIHHVYANDRALRALKRGGPFPDGSVLVFDLLEARREEGAIVEGPRKIIGVMEKDSRRFSATGGWGFEGFKGDTRERLVKEPASECFSCHQKERGQDYVLSRYRR